MAAISCPLMFAMFFGDLVRMIHVPISHLTALYVGVLVSTVSVVWSCLRGAEASIKATTSDGRRDGGRPGAVGLEAVTQRGCLSKSHPPAARCGACGLAVNEGYDFFQI